MLAPLPRWRSLALLPLLALVACQPAAPSASSQPPGATAASSAPSRVIVGITETLESPDPYAATDPVKFGIWCEVYGCLIRQNWDTGTYDGVLAESWTNENPTTWTFNLRKNLKFRDGTPLTSADVVHSFDQARNDPTSLQGPIISPIDSVVANGDTSFKIITKQPSAVLLNTIKDVPITSKATFDNYGADAYKDANKSNGAGPYMYRDLLADQYAVIDKSPTWWNGPVQGPDEVMYKIVREDTSRLTALLNNEMQMAMYVPPNQVDRLTGGNANVVPYDAIDGMFLAMRPDAKPFDNKLVRQAVGYAIDRDTIIKTVLLGYGNRLDGPIGQGRYGYNAGTQPKYTFDPEKARQLLSEAGYPNGVDVQLFTPVGHYTKDKEITEAISQMLTAVGIRTQLMAPDWGTLWPNVMQGKVPFYYMGRLIFDPDDLRTYFEKGVTPRIGFSNPAFDGLMQKQRSTFDAEERKKLVYDAVNLLSDEAPAQFLWTHKSLMAEAKNIEYKPRPDDRIFANDIRVK